jgi:hypothetical protein
LTHWLRFNADQVFLSFAKRVLRGSGDSIRTRSGAGAMRPVESVERMAADGVRS